VPGVILNYVDTSLPEYYYYQYPEYYNTSSTAASPEKPFQSIREEQGHEA
jgi:hypothetical protein